MTHWASQYIGLPWEYGGQGPESFDCWGFVRAIQQTQFRVSMPVVTVPESWAAAHQLIEGHEERGNWIRVSEPMEGDLVLMARNKYPVHVGIMILVDGRLGVLHCIQHSGVVFNTVPSLRSCGWGALSYYRRAV